MIELIHGYPNVERQALLRSMFADRKRLFVDLYGWNIPVVDNAYEIDQFDDAHTAYVIATAEDGRHDASLRLYPSDRPHMLSELFPHLCPMGVPSGATIWETTRLCLPQRHRAERRRELRHRLFSATIDYAIANGIDRLTGVIPEPFRRELLAMGWQAEPLGPAVRIDGSQVGAFQVRVDHDTPQRLRWTGVYREADLTPAL